ncbi:MAG: hypothetical protein V5A61_09830 [Haloarculaceae archaeon]|jgi:hypothetical protein
MIVDLLAEMRAGWADATTGERLHVCWYLANDVLALALVASVPALFLASAGPGFPTGGWLAVVAVAVLWLVSIVVVDPVADRFVYD